MGVRASALAVVAGVATVGLPVATADARAAASECWSERVAAANEYVATRPGVVAFALVTPAGVTYHRAGRRGYPAASLLKTSLMVTYLRSAPVRGRDLTARDRGLLGPMIRRSDNDATNVVVSRLSRHEVLSTAAATQQRDFTYELPVWGLSQTSALDQVRLFRRIDTAVPSRHRPYANRLLAGIVPEQRWGLATVVPDGWSIRFKGGWGSATGRITSQAGIVERDGRRIAIAVLTKDNPTHAAGVATIRGVGRRLLANARCVRRPT